jgi:uroporphyrin-III C-methyltransferase
VTLGRVYIVGAGPGDPRLITVRGLECIRSADVLVHDRLVSTALLDQAPAAAERIYAGKEPHDHSVDQARIHDLLALHAEQGRTVVRLKGGDPFVFGRGGEEAAFLASRGIPFEVVPGVTSAVAVPALAGIPLTQRGVAASFAVATGHACGGAGGPDYAALLRGAGTLVILMGVRSLPAIVQQLRSGGAAGDTPVALISNGSRAEQRVVVSTLASVVEDARDAAPPGVIVIGEVVRLRDQLVPLAAELAIDS